MTKKKPKPAESRPIGEWVSQRNLLIILGVGVALTKAEATRQADRTLAQDPDQRKRGN